jgi:hypothetical protein
MKTKNKTPIIIVLIEDDGWNGLILTVEATVMK